MKKVNLITLGCPKNQVDSEYIEGIIQKDSKFKLTDKPEKAEIIIINTCGFIEDAKEESIETIIKAGKYKEEKKCEVLIVTGCLTQRYQDKIIDGIPEIDAILGTGNFDRIIEIINKTLSGEKLSEIDEPDFDYKSDLPRNIATSHYSYVKIAEGCNNHCSYCVIPQIRGGVNSRPIHDIYQEVVQLTEKGVKEIILVAQDITQYGIDIYQKSALVSLLKELVTIEDIHWLRLLYGYPERITKDLIEIISSQDIICDYLDIPIQHSEAGIRKKMGRKGTREDILNLINRLRDNIPKIALRTSLIVGFPGETETQFEELLDFVKEVKFERLGVFKYSREKGTEAAGFTDQVEDSVKERRYNKIMETQQNISLEKNKKLINRKLPVIIDEIYDDYTIARSEYDAPEIDNQIIINNTDFQTGDVIRCQITEAYEYDLIGEKI